MSIPILSNGAHVTDWQTENLLMYLVLNSDDNCRTGVTIEIDAIIQIGHNFFLLAV